MTEMFQGASIWQLGAWFGVTFLIGGFPNAYLITRWVSGEDVSEHGTGNVGAMNVRRTTGSWLWFTVAMLADALKGMIPTGLAAFGIVADVLPGFTPSPQAAAMVAVVGTVVGHNYSAWLAIAKRRFGPTGKGLATGGGALLAYDWQYFLLVLGVGLAMIAVTRVMMAGQVSAAVALPVYTILTGAPDWPFALALGLVVYVRHHKRFMGLIAGREPKLYVEDGQGPRG